MFSASEPGRRMASDPGQKSTNSSRADRLAEEEPLNHRSTKLAQSGSTGRRLSTPSTTTSSFNSRAIAMMAPVTFAAFSSASRFRTKLRSTLSSSRGNRGKVGQRGVARAESHQRIAVPPLRWRSCCRRFPAPHPRPAPTCSRSVRVPVQPASTPAASIAAAVRVTKSSVSCEAERFTDTLGSLHPRVHEAAARSASARRYHPVTDIDNQAGLLGNVDKFEWAGYCRVRGAPSATAPPRPG